MISNEFSLQTPSRIERTSNLNNENTEKGVNPLLLESNLQQSSKLIPAEVSETPKVGDGLQTIQEDLNDKSFNSLTSSGLLAKHNANIARLAQSMGISMNIEQEHGKND